MSQYLTVGVVGKSRKENENRVPIHPEHIALIPEELRRLITFEQGYGIKFGMTDGELANLTSGRVANSHEILNNFDCVLMPKPLAEDLAQVKEGSLVWGWPHFVQQKEITQVSIDRKLSVIAWEAMFSWGKAGNSELHTFYKNNEIAGYAGVKHALSLIGVDGNYGKQRKAVVISFGSVSRGAVYALQGQGFNDITVYTGRPSTQVKDQLPGVVYKQMRKNDSGNMLAVEEDGSIKLFADALSDVEIIVNGTMQNPENPKTFVGAMDSHKLRNGALIIDISCDEGMGFWCAKPTTFDNPMFQSDGKYYYAVDHSPSWYWNSASWEISKALIPFLPVVMGGPNEWAKNETISKAMEIRDGVIQNPKILSFQNRGKEYPHNVI